MQSSFYLLEEGEAHQRAGKLNLALKRFHGIIKVPSALPLHIFQSAKRRLAVR